MQGESPYAPGPANFVPSPTRTGTSAQGPIYAPCWHCGEARPTHKGPDCEQHPDRLAALRLAAEDEKNFQREKPEKERLITSLRPCNQFFGKAPALAPVALPSGGREHLPDWCIRRSSNRLRTLEVVDNAALRARRSQRVSLRKAPLCA